MGPKLSSFLSKNAGIAGPQQSFSESSTLCSLMCAKVKMAMAAGEDFDKTCPSVSKILDAPVIEVNEPMDADEHGPTVDFYVDGKMVHIADMKVEGTYGRHFIKLIETYSKMEEKGRVLTVATPFLTNPHFPLFTKFHFKFLGK